jgi:hypothetical protein
MLELFLTVFAQKKARENTAQNLATGAVDI